MTSKTARKRTKTAKPSSYGEVAYTRLKRAIQDGVFKPGEPIREIRVAEWLNISRTPVRDAIRRLQNEGLLSYRLHDGILAFAEGNDLPREWFHVGFGARIRVLKAVARTSDSHT